MKWENDDQENKVLFFFSLQVTSLASGIDE